MLLHLVKSVYDHGPLWSSSLFVFEDWNGDIGNYFHGTQNIANQVGSCIIIIVVWKPRAGNKHFPACPGKSQKVLGKYKSCIIHHVLQAQFLYLEDITIIP